MKEITAYVRPDRADDVILALEEIGIKGLTVIDVAAIAGWTDPRSARYSSRYAARYGSVVKLELICLEAQVDAIVAAIRAAGATGQPGDGMIFISSMDEAISIRTGERGPDAI
ncbi:MAG: P-II family nitrogen regulator [Candidatus Neomarinimicrobiota bacterium]